METVKVKRDGPRGWKLINKCDFDPKKHELYEDAKAGDKKTAGNAALTVEQLKAKLAELKVEHDPKLNKAGLVELLDKAEAGLVHPNGSDVKTLTDEDAKADLEGTPRPDAGSAQTSAE